MDWNFVSNLILASVRMATPLIFLALAELYSQRAGLVHIGLEGLASIGSLVGFLVSLIIQQLYRELMTVADEHGGRLPNRVIFFADEFGTIPKLEGAEMLFSAARRLFGSHHVRTAL